MTDIETNSPFEKWMPLLKLGRLPRMIPFSTIAAQSYDQVIDVRSPSEFREDRLPSAVNLPVLTDQERHLVGYEYVQGDKAVAKLKGASLISQNISHILNNHFVNVPVGKKLLIYCWRGGQRSRSLALVLAQIGWDVGILEGGYKGYRKYVIDVLNSLPQKFEWIRVNGKTGCGKTRFLREKLKCGHQVLDLEALANHKGSLLGQDQSHPQPSQKLFETLIAEKIQEFSSESPIWVESESKFIGRLFVPTNIFKCMKNSKTFRIEKDIQDRVALLKLEYKHFIEEPASLYPILDKMVVLHSHTKVNEWKELVSKRKWDEFIQKLLVEHYDPCYERHM